MLMRPLVGIVLVNWNALADTLECLDSLARLEYPKIHIIVVDNGSRDDESAAIQQHSPHVIIHASQANLGYTGGNNIGIRIAMEQGADYILCLNNDTLVEPNFLSRLVSEMEAAPLVGLATPAIYEAHHPEALAGIGCELLLGQTICGRPILKTPIDDLSPFEVPYVEGCAMLMRRIVADQIGGFDDRLFAYFEDADLCLRASERGWRCLAVPSARIWHKVNSKQTGSGSPTAWFYSSRNSVYISRRYSTLRERRALWGDQRLTAYRMLRECLRNRVIQTDPNASRDSYERFASLVLGITAGRTGFYGNRNTLPWKFIECVLRLILYLIVITLTPIVYALLLLNSILRNKRS